MIEEDPELAKIREKKLKSLIQAQKTAQHRTPTPPKRGVEVLNAKDFRQFISSDKISVIDFYADWCNPCKMMAPVMEELAKEFPDVAQFGKINVDYNQQIAVQYGAQSIPLFVFFKNGKPVHRVMGAVGPNPFKLYLKKQRERQSATDSGS